MKEVLNVIFLTVLFLGITSSYAQIAQLQTSAIEQIYEYSPDDNSCNDLHRALQKAEFCLADWQAMLRYASPSHKPVIVKQIRKIQREITAIKAQLHQSGCI